MRKLTGAVFQSIDGVMQAPGAPEEDSSGGFTLGGWSFPFWDDSMNGPFEKIIEADYDLLLGKRTYDIFAGYWPNHRDVPIGERFQRINKYVLTHASEPLEWKHSSKLTGGTADAVAALKQSEGRDLLIQGSSTLYPPLLAAGLIDRLLLMIFPVMLGKGTSIFDGYKDSGAFRLVDHALSDKGVIFATYEPAGAVQVGSFDISDPGEADSEHRAKIAAEG